MSLPAPHTVLPEALPGPSGLDITLSAAAALQRGATPGAEVALLCRVVAVTETEMQPQATRRVALLDLGELEVLQAAARAPAVIERAVRALRSGERLVARGRLAVDDDQRPVLQLHGLAAPSHVTTLLGASARELAAADEWLAAQARAGALDARLLELAVAAVSPHTTDPADALALRLTARDPDGAPAGRLALAARLLLLQALSGVATLAAAPASPDSALGDNPRLHLAVLGPAPLLSSAADVSRRGWTRLAALAAVLDLTTAPGSPPPRPQARALRGRVALHPHKGWTASVGTLATRDGGTWLLPLDEAAWRGAAPRRCLLEVLEGRLATQGRPVEMLARCAVLLLGPPSALLRLAPSARQALQIALSLDSAVHLPEEERDPASEEPAPLELQEAEPPCWHAAQARWLRVLVARLLDRTRSTEPPHEVSLSGVTSELHELDQTLLTATGRLLRDLLTPGDLARAVHRHRGAAPRLTMAAARLAGRSAARAADVEEAWRALAFKLEHLRWLRHQLLGSEPPDLATADEEAGERFAERLQRYGWRPLDAEEVVAEARHPDQLSDDEPDEVPGAAGDAEPLASGPDGTDFSEETG